MIIELLLKIWIFILQVIVWFLPDWQLPQNFMEAFGNTFSYLEGFNTFFPVHTILTCFSWLIKFELTILSIKLISSMLSYFRGGGKLEVE